MIAPPKMLEVNVQTATPQANWPADSSTYAGEPYRWTVTFQVTAQPHSSATTRAPYAYTGLDIAVGDWLSSATNGFAWKIVSFSSQSNSAVVCVVEDVNQFNTYADPTTSGDGSPRTGVNGFVFSVDAIGFPILIPMTQSVLISKWQTEILSRFLYTGLTLASIYDLIGYWRGKLPSDTDPIHYFKIARAITLPIDLTGSRTSCLIPPTAAVSLSLKKNSVEVGTMDFALGATDGTFTFSAPITFAVGDVWEVDPPNPQDATFAGLTWTIVTTVS